MKAIQSTIDEKLYTFAFLGLAECDTSNGHVALVTHRVPKDVREEFTRLALAEHPNLEAFAAMAAYFSDLQPTETKHDET